MARNLWAAGSEDNGGIESRDRGNILAFLRQPSPAPDARFKAFITNSVRPLAGIETSVPGDRKVPVDLDQVTELAKRGLTIDEIRAELTFPAVLDDDTIGNIDLAIAKGRRLGRAEIKKANYDAAVSGGVSAQKQVLEMLDDDTGTGVASHDKVTVVRRVIESSHDDA